MIRVPVPVIILITIPWTRSYPPTVRPTGIPIPVPVILTISIITPITISTFTFIFSPTLSTIRFVLFIWIPIPSRFSLGLPVAISRPNYELKETSSVNIFNYKFFFLMTREKSCTFYHLQSFAFYSSPPDKRSI